MGLALFLFPSAQSTAGDVDVDVDVDDHGAQSTAGDVHFSFHNLFPNYDHHDHYDHDDVDRHDNYDDEKDDHGDLDWAMSAGGDHDDDDIFKIYLYGKKSGT